MGDEEKIIELSRKLTIATMALEFYAQAKVLFFVTDERHWKAKNPAEGIMSGGLMGIGGPTNYKDDGNRAREALTKMREIT